MKHNHTKWLKWVVWALAACFYFYEYLLRVSPSVMIPELMRAFDVDAGAVGLMIAFYLYAYAPMQLIVGVLMDLFGAKRLLIFASAIVGIGAILFGFSGHIVMASAGRFCIGFGSAFAFVGMVVVCSLWFPKKKRALVIGLGNSIGMLGAAAGGGPLSVALMHFQWRVLLEALGIFGLILAVCIFVFFQGKGEKVIRKKSSAFKDMKSYIWQVCKNRYSWLNAVIASLFYLTTTTFGGLWGASFLQSSYGWNKQAASFAMSMIFVGWIIGGPLMGFISDALKKRQAIITSSIFFALLALLGVLYIPGMPPFVVYTLLLIIGIFSSAELLHFSYAMEINTDQTRGTAVAFTNGVVSLVESAVQPLIGLFLVLSWTGIEKGGIPVYSAQNYHYSLSILPIGLFIAFFLSFLLKEKRYVEEDSPHSSFVENVKD